MEPETLVEVPVPEPELKLPPMPEYLAVYAWRDNRHPDVIRWGTNEELSELPVLAVNEAMYQPNGYTTIPGSIRVFRIPQKGEAWTVEQVRAAADAYLDKAGFEFSRDGIMDNLINFARVLGVLPKEEP